MIYISRVNLREEIIKYLEYKKFAIGNQIISYFNVKDGRNIFYHIEKLLVNKQIEEINYNNLKFYALPDTESEIFDIINLIRSNIVSIIRLFGPMIKKEVAIKMENLFKYSYGRRLLWRLMRELVTENDLQVKRISGVITIYYIDDQEKDAKRIIKSERTKRRTEINLLRIERINEEFFNLLVNDWTLKPSEEKLLKDILIKIRPLIFNFLRSGRRIEDFIFILSELQIKKEIFLLTKKKPPFERIKPLLAIFECISSHNREFFKGRSYRRYLSYANEIVSCEEFCEKSIYSDVLHAPNLFLQMKYHLTKLDLNEAIIDKIYNLIVESTKKGYDIQNRRIGGVLGGATHIISEIEGLGLTQRELAERFGTNLMSLNKEKKILKKMLFEFQ